MCCSFARTYNHFEWHTQQQQHRKQLAWKKIVMIFFLLFEKFKWTRYGWPERQSLNTSSGLFVPASLKIVCSIVLTAKCVCYYKARAFNCFMVTLIVTSARFVFNGQRRGDSNNDNFVIFPLFWLGLCKSKRKKNRLKFTLHVVSKCRLWRKVWDIMLAINSFGSNK